MNKVITINLNGNAYQLEENGYESLRAYLDTAARRLEGNPDKGEIIADIEQAIADKFRAGLGSYKTVVVTTEVERVIAEMGPVEDASIDDQPVGSGPRAAGAADRHDGPKTAGESAASAKRLYKIDDGAMLGGVCTGLAAYLNLDVTIVRILFVILTVVSYGAGILLYLLMWLLVPAAQTSAEKAAAYGGIPASAQEFIRRAKQGYYEGMKTFHDKRAHRQWKRKFKQEMRGWKRDFHRQMHEHSSQWKQNWQQPWEPCPRRVGVPGLIAIFLLSLLKAVIALVALFAAFSLLITGAIFGLLLPVGIPVWIGLIFLLIAYNIVVSPLKALRRACWYGHGHLTPFAGLWDSLAWLAVLALLFWLVDRYVPHAHEVLQNLPAAIHHVVDSMRDWWTSRPPQSHPPV